MLKKSSFEKTTSICFMRSIFVLDKFSVGVMT